MMGFDGPFLFRLNKILLFLLGAFFAFLWIVQNSLSAQDSRVFLKDSKDLLAYIEERYGADDLLMNGSIYVPLHSLAIGHPYFEVHDWVLSTLYVKRHRFDQVKLKYDIELDEFVLFILDKQERKNYLLLNRHYVDSVRMGKYVFVNADNIPGIPEKFGYLENVYDRQFYFFVTHHKDFKKEFSESKPHGEYSEQTSTRYILDDGRLTKVNSKKAFLSYFEPYKSELKSYLRKNKIKYKKANSGQLYNLLIYCEGIQSK
jgi:hypothetical protein